MGEHGDRHGRDERASDHAALFLEQALDLVVFNDISREDIGFDASDNEVVLIGAGGERRVGKAPKARIAAEILDEVERLL